MPHEVDRSSGVSDRISRSLKDDAELVPGHRANLPLAERLGTPYRREGAGLAGFWKLTLLQVGEVLGVEVGAVDSYLSRNVSQVGAGVVAYGGGPRTPDGSRPAPEGVGEARRPGTWMADG